MEEQLNKMTGEECVAAEDNYYLLSIYMKRRGGPMSRFSTS